MKQSPAYRSLQKELFFLFFLNPLRMSLPISCPSSLNILVCISYKQRHFSYKTSIQPSKSRHWHWYITTVPIKFQWLFRRYLLWKKKKKWSSGSCIAKCLALIQLSYTCLMYIYLAPSSFFLPHIPIYYSLIYFIEIIMG